DLDPVVRRQFHDRREAGDLPARDRGARGEVYVDREAVERDGGAILAGEDRCERHPDRVAVGTDLLRLERDGRPRREGKAVRSELVRGIDLPGGTELPPF